MARTPREVTDAELAVLESLWEQGPSTVRSLAAAIYGDTGASACASVQKLCDRLAAKGFVAGERGARPRRFRATAAREDLIGSHLDRLAERLCGGAYLPLLSHLVDGDKLRDAEIRELRELVERLDRATRRPRRKKR